MPRAVYAKQALQARRSMLIAVAMVCLQRRQPLVVHYSAPARQYSEKM